jgi:DNA repair exonuclease SbcCD nuclease subunit
MIKLAHISDIHIHNYKMLDEQKQVFDNLYTSLRQEKPDYIIMTGDVFHVKTNITPEAYETCYNFFMSLADIADVHMIIGNHDISLSNKSRLDSITPVFNAVKTNKSNIYFHKYTEMFSIQNMDFYVLSFLDKKWEKTPFVLDDTKINISLYHGGVKGAMTDSGWIVPHGDVDLKTLRHYDYGLLGDIHKSNQIVDGLGKIRYAGSLCQNTFGEDNDKGYLIWEIFDKENYDVKHIHIPNPKPYITIHIDRDGDIFNADKISKNCRLRVTSELPEINVKSILHEYQNKYDLDSVTFINKKVSGVGETKIRNYRDEESQVSLIKEFFTDKNIDEETLNKVIYINNEIYKQVSSDQDIQRNISWKLLKLEWSNLFNYAEGNFINFENREGLYGLFGKNYSGKSSVIDALLFAIYGTTSKNIRKNLNILNIKKQNGSATVYVDIGGKKYKIHRTIEKYQKKLKGIATDDAKSNVDFILIEDDKTTNLNGTEKFDTDKIISQYFGTIDDFLTTCLSSQSGQFSFINEGSTKRKEILAKFLDIEFYDACHKSGKEKFSFYKTVYDKYKSRNFDLEILDLEKEREELNIKITTLSEREKELEDKVHSFQASTYKNTIERMKVKQEYEETLKEISEINQNLIEVNRSLSLLDKETLDVNISMADFAISKSSEYKNTILINEKELSICKKSAEDLNGLPCTDKMQDVCPYVSSAKQSKNKISSLEIKVNDTRKQLSEILGKIDSLKLLKEQSTKEIANLNQLLERKRNFDNALTKYSNKKNELSAKLDEMIFNVDDEDNFKNDQIIKNEYQEVKKQILSLTQSNGALIQKQQNTLSDKENFDICKQNYHAYELYCDAVHSNGIPFMIIKSNISVINDELKKVLSSICDFTASFEPADNKLDINLYSPGLDITRPVENGSGAERTLVSMAIRTALTNITTLPKSNLFILDEPGTALDITSMKGLTRYLEEMKNYFDLTLLISHIDYLKDSVDQSIEVQTKDGFATIQY